MTRSVIVNNSDWPQKTFSSLALTLFPRLQFPDLRHYDASLYFENLFLPFDCSHDGKYLTSGSENQCVFLWRTQYESANITARKDRNNFYEAIKGD